MRWTIVCEAKRGEIERQGVISGRDVYGLTAAAIVRGAAIAARKGFEARGALAPSQAFDPKDFLSELERFDVRWQVVRRGRSRSRSRPELPEAIGLPARRGRAVSLEEGAGPGRARCPAVRRAALRLARDDRVRGARGPGDRSLRELRLGRRSVTPSPLPSRRPTRSLAAGEQRDGERSPFVPRTPPACRPGSGPRTGRRCARAGTGSSRRRARHGCCWHVVGFEVRRVRHLAARRDGLDVADAAQPAHLPPRLRLRGGLGAPASRHRPRPGRVLRPTPLITVLAAIPTALIAVLLEGGAVLARRGGVIEVEAERLPSTD